MTFMMSDWLRERQPERLPEPQPQILIVARDEILREMLRLLLEDAGYRAASCADGDLARKLLRIARHPLVVLLAHGGSDQSWNEVFSAAATLPAHLYVLLTTQRPEHLPELWNPYTETAVPVIPMPFDVEGLIQHVADAVSQRESLPDEPHR